MNLCALFKNIMQPILLSPLTDTWFINAPICMDTVLISESRGAEEISKINFVFVQVTS